MSHSVPEETEQTGDDGLGAMNGLEAAPEGSEAM